MIGISLIDAAALSSLGPRTALSETAGAEVFVWSDVADSYVTVDPGGGDAQRTVRLSAAPDRTVSLDGERFGLDARVLAHLRDRADRLETAETLYADGSGFAGHAVSVLPLRIDGDDLLVMGAGRGAALSVYRQDGDGGLTPLSALSGGAVPADIAAMASVTYGDRAILVAATADGLASFEVTSGGALRRLDRFTPEDGLPVAAPSGLAIVEMETGPFVVLTAAGTSSVTVLSLGWTGTLDFVDQIVDGRASRFDGAAAMDWIGVDGRMLGAVAGRDGGVSILELLPDGRPVHLGAIEGTAEAPLDDVADIDLVRTPNGIELFVSRSAGSDLARYAISPGGGTIADRDGETTLRGSAGADLFVIGADGARDRIAGFQPGRDAIDLSGAGRFYALSAEQIVPTATGARVTIGGEILDILSAGGGRLSRDQVIAAARFDVTRVEALVPQRIGRVDGGPGDDRLSGSAATEFLFGYRGDDRFLWSPGADTVNGGAGRDTLDLTAAGRGATVDLTDPSHNDRAVAGAQFVAVEHVEGTEYRDRLSGSDDANHLGGAGGDDTIEGRGGDDVLLGGGGDDRLFGHAGRDALHGGAGSDLLSGGAQADVLNGAAGGDVLRGEGGDDTLKGAAGHDRLVGGVGDDLLSGGAGHDVLNGGAGIDMASYRAAAGAVSVNLGTGRGAGSEAAGDRFYGIENVFGSAHSDHLVGDGAGNFLHGSTGHDVVLGGGGSDTLIGARGNDRLFGGPGDDVLSGGPGRDRLVASGGHDRLVAGDQADTLIGGAGDGKLLGGSGNDLLLDGSGDGLLYGDRGDDRMTGRAGNDRLLGRQGDDRLSGGGGRDTVSGDDGDDLLSGGSGRDLFVFRDGGGRDTVLDFEDGADRLLIAGDLLAPGIDTARQLVDRHAEGANGHTVFDFGNGDRILLTGIADPGALADDILIV